MSLAILDPATKTRAPLPPLGVARDITYANSARSRPGRAFIRVMENATGRLGLIRRAAGYEADLAQGADFWRVMADRFGLRLDIVGGSLAQIPADGPLVVVANHPYGLLDGLVLGHILSGIRGGEFKILAHGVFRKAEALDRVILPIDFSGTRDAVETNLQTRATAIRYLQGGGAIGIFPGGTVSTAPRPFARPMDPVWRAFTARMIQKSGATVVPIWFDGANSRLFQVASHMHYTLRMALLVREFRRRVDRPVRLAIGAPIGPNTLRSLGDGTQVMDYLRRTTYGLSPDPLDASRLGYEFEEHHKR